MYAQAHAVIEKFGGARTLAAALNVKPSTVYKWTYPREKGGTDGLIPSSRLPAIMDAAETLGVPLRAADLDPTLVLVE